ncbi:MAG TPA: alginate export family protein [Spirochaetota bacterium]|nr:alginate export family protein [Spirochaetota bacterium]HNT11747.1 alginate export family protein [Spirochaetota bacterium]
MNLRRVAILWCVCMALASGAYAQGSENADRDDSFYPDFRSDEDMRAQRFTREPFSISYGGWLMPMVIDERRNDQVLTTSVNTAKLWIKSTLWGKSYVYVRGKDQYYHILKHDGIGIREAGGSDGIKLNENKVDLDVGYLAVSTDDNMLQVYAGRKFFILGSGLALNGRGDGIQVDLNTSVADVRVFGMYTGLLQKDFNPYGLSDEDIAVGARRYFAGSMVQRTLWNQTLYLFAMAQLDNGRQQFIRSRYNSQYYGIGLKGVITDSVEYFGEFVYESGESYLKGKNEKRNVNAAAAQAGVNWYLPLPLEPVFMVQYAYGSGDEDRYDCASPTANQAGEDNGFIYFGTFLGGYALRPLLSNLHIARGGFSLSPFSWSESRFLRRMNVTAKYSYYMKDKPKGVINYNEAPLEETEVGHGADASFRWRIFYDLSIFVNYAMFFPGKAYVEGEKNRQFIQGGCNFIF